MAQFGVLIGQAAPDVLVDEVVESSQDNHGEEAHHKQVADDNIVEGVDGVEEEEVEEEEDEEKKKGEVEEESPDDNVVEGVDGMPPQPGGVQHIQGLLVIIRTFSGLSEEFSRTYSGLSHEFLRTFSEFSQDFLRTFSGLSQDLLMTFS